DGGRTVSLMPEQLPPNNVPDTQATIIAPRLVELCFQTAGMKEMIESSRMALPLHIDSVTLFGADAGEARCGALVSASDGGGFDADVVDESGKLRMRVKGYRTVALPGEVDTTVLRVLHAVAH